MNNRETSKLENYKLFFSDQIREAEIEQKTIAKSPVSQLLRKEEVAIGYVDHVNISKGHVIIRFLKDRGPRLKVQKSLCVIKPKAFKTLGKNFYNWDCPLIEFLKNSEFHSVYSELMPLYYLKGADSTYDYIGCSSINTNIFDLIKVQADKGISLPILVFNPFPPVDYLKNLITYMELNPGNQDLWVSSDKSYEDWDPEELSYNPKDESAISRRIMEVLESDSVCVLQGPPGTGKSYTIAQIIAQYLKEGKTVCATTMANKGLIELVQQPPLKPFLEKRLISKTNLTADEREKAKGLKPTVHGLIIPAGELLCSTNYVLSYAFNTDNRTDFEIPTYDLVVIEEASQAFLTTIAAFKSLGRKCLIVGDPMQLPPVVSNIRKNEYRTWGVNTQIEGLQNFALATNVRSFRITTTFRLTPKSAKLTGIFYNNRFTSVQKEMLDFTTIESPFFPPEGGVLYHCTQDFTNGVYSFSAISMISEVIDTFKRFYPRRTIAIITPFKDTVKQFQKRFLTENGLNDLTVETIDRIQGMTVDYAIVYIPGRYPGFAFDKRRFNVATSRSRSTTLVITDEQVDNFHSIPLQVKQFLNNAKPIDFALVRQVTDHSSTDFVKLLYPGLESIVGQLIANGIEFSQEGDVDLTDSKGVVIASSGMLLRQYRLAIDPVDSESESVFQCAGYRTVKSTDFNLNMLK